MEQKFFLKTKNTLSKNKNDIFMLLLLFLLSLFFFKNFLGTQTLMNNGHYLHEQTLFSYNYKSALEKGTLPFWTPYWYSGQPLFGDSQVFFLNLTHIFLILFKNIFLAINLSTLLYFFISGASMYFLVKYLINSRHAAFISAVMYMFNGLIYGFIVAGNPSILEPYALIPLIFLFIIKAKNANNPINYTILAAILLTFQVFSGGALMLVYTFLLIGLYLSLDLISIKFKKKIVKTMIIGLVLLSILFGLAAVKLLPNYDFIKKTNRAQGLSYQEYIGEDKFMFRDFLKVVVFDKQTSSLKAHIGIVGFLLMLSSIGAYKKKMVISLILISVFIFFLASGGFLAELFYKYVPTFSQTRHISRVMFIFVFSASVLAGYGYSYISNFISKLATKKFKIWDKVKAIFFVIIIFLILKELVFAKGLPRGFNIVDQLEQNELAKYLQQEKDKFRITTFDVDDLISFYGSSYYAYYGLETLSGGGGLWINDFIRYLAIAKSYNNSKLLGILNLKYATFTKEVGIPDFKLVKKFKECIPCKDSDWTYWIGGPYLYENENFLPRYYFVNNSVLVIGNNEESQNIIYGILLNKNFDPKTTVIIHGEVIIDDYDIEFLKKFNAIILLRDSVNKNSLYLLEQYKNSGGKIFPDVLENKNSLDFSEIENVLKSFKGNLINVNSNVISPNEVELTPENKGFLVLSEKFSLFDWLAEKDNKKIQIMHADVVISSVYVDSPGKIIFRFSQNSFKKGLTISLLTLFIILGYWIYKILYRKNFNLYLLL